VRNAYDESRMSKNVSEEILTLPPPLADARIPYSPDPNQFLDLRMPVSKEKKGKPFPLVINIHGGFWRSQYSLDHSGHLCAALTRRQLATANVEYRRVGNEGGAWPGTFADIRTAYHFLIQSKQRHNFDPQNVLVIGHSAGGQLALCLAAHETGVKRVVSLAGVVDLNRAYQLHLSNDAVVDFLRGTPSSVPDHYREADPMQLSIPNVRQVLISGSADDTVPPLFSREYVVAKQQRTQDKKENVQLIEIAGAGHFDLIDPRSQAWKTVEETVLGLLGS
jgi:acetyl esterase/lipase